ncbi:MAG: hypothetical protein ACLT2T_02470 [Bilophila wadsworthia]
MGKEMLILFARFLRIEAFTPLQSQTKRQDPSFSWGCHFENCKQGFDKGESLEGRGGERGREGVGEGRAFSRKFPLL